VRLTKVATNLNKTLENVAASATTNRGIGFLSIDLSDNVKEYLSKVDLLQSFNNISMGV